MKQSLLALSIALAITTVIFSCKKETQSTTEEYVEGWTRVIGVKGTDTSSTIQMNARTETVGLVITEDDKLKAELMSYAPGVVAEQGIYTIRLTSKLNCESTISWGWDGLNIDNITPNSTILTANQVVTYTLTGSAKVGKIKVQVHSDCGNSSTLIVNITTTILPIEFTNATTKRVGNKMIVTFSTEAPQDVDNFFVLWTPDGKRENEVCKLMLISDGITKKYIVSYPAVKKQTK